MLADSRRWAALWIRLGARGEALPIYEELAAQYQRTGRAYHSLVHLSHCLAELDAVAGVIGSRDTIEYALWFHDAIYDPKAKDNEEQSALWAVRVAVGAVLGEPFANSASRLIMATKHTSVPVLADEQILVDIDLAILGQDEAAFDRYEREVRLEYAWVPEEAFRQGRAAILRSFLDRPRIYSTPHFFKRYESIARANLVRSIQRLERG